MISKVNYPWLELLGTAVTTSAAFALSHTSITSASTDMVLCSTCAAVFFVRRCVAPDIDYIMCVGRGSGHRVVTKAESVVRALRSLPDP